MAESRPLLPGLNLRVRRVEGAPVAAVRAWVRAGARIESTPGQALLTGRLLTEGTKRRDWRRIAEEADARGAIVSSFETFECHGVSIDALAEDWEQALAWAAEMILEPSFPEDRCAWIARQANAELESLADQPEIKTSWGFFEQLYTPHPRSRPLQGNPESLLALTPEECAGFHAQALGQGLSVTVAGVVDAEAVAARVAELFAALPPAGPPAAEPAAPLGLPERRRQVATEAEDQAHLYLGHLTVPRSHPDYTALEVLAVILGSGAGLTGRIPNRIREQEGLAYSAYAQTVSGSGIDPGRLIAYVGTSPETVEKALDGVVEEITRVVDEGVLTAEVEEARAYLLGREPFRRETARQWAELLVDAELYQLPLDDSAWRIASLEAVDTAAVEAAARRHIRPEELRVTVGLPE
ncbi:MAG TPA: pitrilysin family protein [Thermoanaerobaculia bacterium]|nr:pitrilysin family protein [Thermoanaerobaculia bacterium]